MARDNGLLSIGRRISLLLATILVVAGAAQAEDIDRSSPCPEGDQPVCVAKHYTAPCIMPPCPQFIRKTAYRNACEARKAGAYHWRKGRCRVCITPSRTITCKTMDLSSCRQSSRCQEWRILKNGESFSELLPRKISRSPWRRDKSKKERQRGCAEWNFLLRCKRKFPGSSATCKKRVYCLRRFSSDKPTPTP